MVGSGALLETSWGKCLGNSWEILGRLLQNSRWDVNERLGPFLAVFLESLGVLCKVCGAVMPNPWAHCPGNPCEHHASFYESPWANGIQSLCEIKNYSRAFLGDCLGNSPGAARKSWKSHACIPQGFLGRSHSGIHQMPGEFSGEMPGTPPGAFPGKREKRENLVKCKVVGCLALSAGAKR